MKINDNNDGTIQPEFLVVVVVFFNTAVFAIFLNALAIRAIKLTINMTGPKSTGQQQGLKYAR